MKSTVNAKISTTIYSTYCSYAYLYNLHIYISGFAGGIFVLHNNRLRTL